MRYQFNFDAENGCEEIEYFVQPDESPVSDDDARAMVENAMYGAGYMALYEDADYVAAFLDSLVEMLVARMITGYVGSQVVYFS